MGTAASAEALVAHVLRRCAIAPDPAQVARFVQSAKDPRGAANNAIEWSLNAPPQAIDSAVTNKSFFM